MTAPTFFTVTADYLPSTDKGTIWGTLEFTMLIASGDTLAIPSLDTIIVPVVTQASLSKGVLVDTTGNPGVELLANAAAVGLSGALYYQVTFNQVWYQAPGEAPVEMPLNTFTFQAPTTGTTVDLSTVTPAAGAVAAQIYAATIPGAGLVKSTGSALATAVSGTDYAPATTGSGLLKGNGSGGFSSATSGTDYAPPTSGSALLKGNGSGGFTAAVANTDYAGPANAVAITGGTLDGVTIGGTTAAVSVNANTLTSPASIAYSGTTGVWLNQSQIITGNASSTTASANYLNFADQVNYTGTATFNGLSVIDYVASPATGGRTAINGQVSVAGIGTGGGAGYIGLGGRATTSVNLGGTSTQGVGQFWGAWITAAINGGTYHYSVTGIEVDVNCMSNSIQQKKGIRIVLGTGDVANDTVRGTLDDTALQVIQNSGAAGWGIGIKFGTDQSSTPATVSGYWPFTDTSTIIGTSAVGNGLPANIGIDFSQITFSDCAIKTGPAPIQMGAMASAPATPASGKGKLYIASDGSLHYVGASGTDTRLAVA